MSCSHCLNAVNKALAGVAGAGIVSVAIGRAVVEHPDAETLTRAVAAITAAGYPATVAPVG